MKASIDTRWTGRSSLNKNMEPLHLSCSRIRETDHVPGLMGGKMSRVLWHPSNVYGYCSSSSPPQVSETPLEGSSGVPRFFERVQVHKFGANYSAPRWPHLQIEFAIITHNGTETNQQIPSSGGDPSVAGRAGCS